MAYNSVQYGRCAPSTGHTTTTETQHVQQKKASVFNWTVVIWIKQGQLFLYLKKKKKTGQEGTRKESREMYRDRSHEEKRET